MEAELSITVIQLTLLPVELVVVEQAHKHTAALDGRVQHTQTDVAAVWH